jgi:hypothetical protein
MKISAYKTKFHGPAAGLKKVILIAVHGVQHPDTANNGKCSKWQAGGWDTDMTVSSYIRFILCTVI